MGEASVLYNMYISVLPYCWTAINYTIYLMTKAMRVIPFCLHVLSTGQLLCKAAVARAVTLNVL